MAVHPLTHAYNNLRSYLMSYLQNKHLSLLEAIFTLDSPTYHNKPTLKPLSIIMICNIIIIMALLRLTMVITI